MVEHSPQIITSEEIATAMILKRNVTSAWKTLVTGGRQLEQLKHHWSEQLASHCEQSYKRTSFVSIDYHDNDDGNDYDDDDDDHLYVN